MAVVRAPTPEPATREEGSKPSVCTYAVTDTATRPKNTNTKGSPRPWYARGQGPPVYAIPAAIEASPTTTTGHPPTQAR